jgi:V/A-type H+-transporting ATPase subunit A
MQHQLAQWADADIVLFIGCGERGNEMAEVLERFPSLKDPRSGQPLMNRTILVANVSNMPIAAREASVYTGITMAEYYRDMGYDIAMQADSTSRWAEALREVSGRLEEMPGEEGYPAYLASRIAEFYERAGRIVCLGSDYRVGSISIVGAVSPPGGDFSEPVTQSTLRMVKVFWALDTELAYRRHFPAIHWLTSYSLYTTSLQKWFEEKISKEWNELREKAMYILQQDAELEEIVRLVGPDALSDPQRAILEAAKMIKEDYLMQHAYHPIDSYCPLNKSYQMLKTIIYFYEKISTAVEKGVPLQKILGLPMREEIARMKIQPYDKIEEISKNIRQKIDEEINNLLKISIEAETK